MTLFLMMVVAGIAFMLRFLVSLIAQKSRHTYRVTLLHRHSPLMTKAFLRRPRLHLVPRRTVRRRGLA